MKTPLWYVEGCECGECSYWRKRQEEQQMSVKDKLAEYLWLNGGGDPIDTPDAARDAIEFLAERGYMVLGPDGEPLNAKKILGVVIKLLAAWGGVRVAETREYLFHVGFTTEEADACLAAVEVQP